MTATLCSEIWLMINFQRRYNTKHLLIGCPVQTCLLNSCKLQVNVRTHDATVIVDRTDWPTYLWLSMFESIAALQALMMPLIVSALRGFNNVYHHFLMSVYCMALTPFNISVHSSFDTAEYQCIVQLSHSSISVYHLALTQLNVSVLSGLTTDVCNWYNLRSKSIISKMPALNYHSWVTSHCARSMAEVGRSFFQIDLTCDIGKTV